MFPLKKNAKTLLFTMWERSVHYVNGRFVLKDERGRRSVISKQKARELERDYLQYQARQAFERGGVPLEQAYGMYGFEQVGQKNGYPQFELAKYAADSVTKARPSG